MTSICVFQIYSQTMKKLSGILLYLFTISLSAQTVISGTVIDKDNRLPVSDVVIQYGNTADDYVYTNSKGRFSIPETSNPVVHIQCIGYKARSVKLETIKLSGIIEIEVNPISLNAVVIGPNVADKMLEEAMLNTKKKLLSDQAVNYLLYCKQTKESDTLDNVLYLKYTSLLTKDALRKEMKKEKIPYELNLIDIKYLDKAPIAVAELFGAEYHASHLFTFGKSENNLTKLSYTEDSTLIQLQIEPLEGKDSWAKGEILLNRKDMSVISISVESVDSILETQPYKKYFGNGIKIVKKKGNYEFKDIAGKYYMSKCNTFYKFESLDKYNRKDYMAYYFDAQTIGIESKKQFKRRKLSGYCQELFYLPNSTEREFWKEWGF